MPALRPGPAFGQARQPHGGQDELIGGTACRACNYLAHKLKYWASECLIFTYLIRSRVQKRNSSRSSRRGYGCTAAVRQFTTTRISAITVLSSFPTCCAAASCCTDLRC